uniref:Uncharacterized protein n=1 Tax=Methanococcus maripaludis (strain C6 / ATCC BAA-1332) TaxID=444158 RepID=A9A6H7_METM6
MSESKTEIKVEEKKLIFSKISWADVVKFLLIYLVLFFSLILLILTLRAIGVSFQIGSEFMISVLLSFFAIILSLMFYFESIKTSNRFYNDVYRFIKDMARMEERFGKELEHIVKSQKDIDEKMKDIMFYYLNMAFESHDSEIKLRNKLKTAANESEIETLENEIETETQKKQIALENFEKYFEKSYKIPDPEVIEKMTKTLTPEFMAKINKTLTPEFMDKVNKVIGAHRQKMLDSKNAEQSDSED